MANFPMALFPFSNQIPGVYGPPPQDLVFAWNESSFTVTKDGYGVLKGNAKDAAYALLKHVITFSELRMRPLSINWQLEFEYLDDKISILWKGKYKPDCFDELKLQFEKLSQLMVFA